MSCAQKLARSRDVHVTLLDKVNYYQFKPLLYQVATSELGLSDIATSLRSLFQDKENVDVKLEEVVSMQPEAKTVYTQDGKSYTGDILVLASGSQPNFFGIPGAAEYSFPLYTFEDARRLRDQVLGAFESADRDFIFIEQGILNFVIVGAGPTGTEFAGGLSDIIFGPFQREFSDSVMQKACVYLVDFLPEVLFAFSPKSRLYAEKELKKRQVHLYLNLAVKEVFPDRILLSDGSSIKTQTVVWAAGVKAASLVGKSGLPLSKGGRVEVEPDLSVKEYPDIYAVGDCANIQDRDGSFLPQLSSVAKQCGEAAAANILATINGKQKKAFQYFDKGIMAIIGNKSAVANIGRRRIEMTGFFAFVAWSLVHAAFLPTFRQRIQTTFKWIWEYFTKTSSLQLIDRNISKKIKIKFQENTTTEAASSQRKKK